MKALRILPLIVCTQVLSVGSWAYGRPVGVSAKPLTNAGTAQFRVRRASAGSYDPDEFKLVSRQGMGSYGALADSTERAPAKLKFIMPTGPFNPIFAGRPEASDFESNQEMENYGILARSESGKGTPATWFKPYSAKHLLLARFMASEG